MKGADDTTPVPSPPLSRRQRTWPRALTVALLAALGAGIAQYATVQDWFATLDQRAEVTGYAESVKSFSGEGKNELLEKARQYNEDVIQGLTANPDEQPDEYYFSQLNPGDNNVMGHLVIPKLNLSLPIYHTVDESSISRGAGHIFGSTLPVDGPTSHAVLSSHSGLVDARLFTDLQKLVLGDSFSITVMDKTLYYTVVQREIVLPDDVSLFEFTANKNYVTLVTCYPTGVNSHRLLVKAELLNPPPDEVIRSVSGAREVDIPHPWWALTISGTGAAAYGLVILVNRPRNAGARAAGARE